MAILDTYETDFTALRAALAHCVTLSDVVWEDIRGRWHPCCCRKDTLITSLPTLENHFYNA